MMMRMLFVMMDSDGDGTVSLQEFEVLVTKFLRDALTVEALGVPKLEAMARAAGLLGEGQRITQAKLFRRAKISLGIRSIRDGFGAGGGWLWGLPPGSDVRAPILATGQERSAPTIPREWVEGVARLEQHRPPPDIPRHRWAQFVQDCDAFLKTEQPASRAVELGWDAMALFGCAPKRPLDYLGSAGLVWAINGGRLLELHRDWAVIDIPVHFLPPECGSGENDFAMDQAD
jgi:hypothetical protein